MTPMAVATSPELGLLFTIKGAPESLTKMGVPPFEPLSMLIYKTDGLSDCLYHHAPGNTIKTRARASPHHEKAQMGMLVSKSNSIREITKVRCTIGIGKRPRCNAIDTGNVCVDLADKYRVQHKF